MDAATSLRDVLPFLGLAFAAGCAAAGWAGWSLWRSARRSLAGHVVDGEVVRVIPLKSAAGSTFVTTFAFTDGNGVRHEVRVGPGTTEAFYRVGERVRVGYDPGAPEGAAIVRPSGLLVVVIGLGSTVAIIAGILFFAIVVAGMERR
jgi:hypothetical protein